MEADTATSSVFVVTDAGKDGNVVIGGGEPLSATTSNKDLLPVISDVTTTPSTILSDISAKLLRESDKADEHQPPLKKAKVEYDPDIENTKACSEDQFADAITTTDAAVNKVVKDDTTINNDSTFDSNSTAVVVVMNSQPQPVDPTPPLVTPTVREPGLTSAGTTHQTLAGDGEDDNVFGSGTDVNSNAGNEISDALVVSVASIPSAQSGDAPITTDDKTPQPINDKQTPTATDVSELEPVIEENSAATTTPVKAPSVNFSIPRKSSHTKTTSTGASGHSKQTYTPGTRYGLPVGVDVPASIVQSKLLEVEMNTPGSKLMDVLKSLPVNLINDALTEYDDAVEIKGANSIRNHGAYLYGVVKRYVSVLERSLNGETVSGQNPMGEDGLTAAIQIRLDQLVTSGFCSHQEMNDKVKSKIRMLSEKDAMCALDDLSGVERSQIRNFGSYLMGILNRYMRGEPSAKKSSLSSMNHHHPNSGNHNTHTTSNHRHPPNHREPSNRFAPPLHNPSSSLSSSFPPNARKNNNNNNMNHNNNNNRFDNRGGGHHGGQQQRPPFRMDQNNQNNAQSFDGHRQQPQQPGTHLVPSWQQNQPTPPNQYGQNNMPNVMGPPSVNSNIPGMPPANFNFPGQQQQMQQYPPQQQQQIPPSSYMPQPVQQQSYGQPSSYPIANTMQPQSGLSPNVTGMYQPQPNGMMMGQPQNQQPFLGNPSSHQQPSPMMNQSSSQFVPNHLSQTLQGSIDILGLADKAASAIQALGANNKLNQAQPGYPPQQHMPPQQQQGYPPPYNTGSGMNQASNMNMQQPPRPGQPTFHQNQMYPPQQQHPPAFSGPNSMNQPPPQQQQGGRRRTTASLHELPMSVQYALQVRGKQIFHRRSFTLPFCSQTLFCLL